MESILIHCRCFEGISKELIPTKLRGKIKREPLYGSYYLKTQNEDEKIDFDKFLSSVCKHELQMVFNENLPSNLSSIAYFLESKIDDQMAPLPIFEREFVKTGYAKKVIDFSEVTYFKNEIGQLWGFWEKYLKQDAEIEDFLILLDKAINCAIKMRNPICIF